MDPAQSSPRTPYETADRENPERIPSAELPCPLWAYGPVERFAKVSSKSRCQNPKGEPTVANVKCHLIQWHLHTCRRCKEPIEHQNKKPVKSAIRYNEVIKSAHSNCELKEWPEGMELTKPPLLSSDQEDVVLNSRQDFALRKHEGESEPCFQWRKLYKMLYPKVSDDVIPPLTKPFNMPICQHEAAIRELTSEIESLKMELNNRPVEAQDFKEPFAPPGLGGHRDALEADGPPQGMLVAGAYQVGPDHAQLFGRELDLDWSSDFDSLLGMQNNPSPEGLAETAPTNVVQLSGPHLDKEDERRAQLMETRGDDDEILTRRHEISREQAREASNREESYADSGFHSNTLSVSQQVDPSIQGDGVDVTPCVPCKRKASETQDSDGDDYSLLITSDTE